MSLSLMYRSLTLAVAMVAAGCGSVTTYRFALERPTGQISPTPPAVFFEGQLPQQGMQELAMVEAVGTGTRASVEDVVNALQLEASRFGASAVVRVRVDCGYSQCHGWGVAVKYVGK
jgi:hypothetical protein